MEQAGDEENAAQRIMDAKVRGRSPRRDDKACSRFDSMRKKNPSSKSSRRKDENALHERRSRSPLSAQTTLKPDAPDFVPHSLPRNVPYLSCHSESPQNLDAHSRSESRIDLFRTAIAGKGECTPLERSTSDSIKLQHCRPCWERSSPELGPPSRTATEKGQED